MMQFKSIAIAMENMKKEIKSPTTSFKDTWTLPMGKVNLVLQK